MRERSYENITFIISTFAMEQVFAATMLLNKVEQEKLPVHTQNVTMWLFSKPKENALSFPSYQQLHYTQWVQEFSLDYLQ